MARASGLHRGLHSRSRSMSGQHLRAGRTDLGRSLRPRGRSNKGAVGSGGREASEECSSSSNTDLIASMGRADKALSRMVYEKASRVVPKPALKLLETCGSGLIWFPLSVAAVWATANSSPPMPLALPASNFLAGLILDVAIVGSVKVSERSPSPTVDPFRSAHTRCLFPFAPLRASCAEGGQTTLK